MLWWWQGLESALAVLLWFSSIAVGTRLVTTIILSTITPHVQVERTDFYPLALFALLLTWPVLFWMALLGSLPLGAAFAWMTRNQIRR